MNNLVYILIGHPLQLKPLIVNTANLVIAYDNYKKVTERSPKLPGNGRFMWKERDNAYIASNTYIFAY